MVTRFIPTILLAGLLMCGVATAQQQGDEGKRPASTSVEDVTAAAHQAAKGETDSNLGFMEAQSRRAAEIRTKARKNKSEVELLQQAERVAEQSAKHKDWAQREFERARGIASATIDAADAEFNAGKKQRPRPKILVFVSQSMGKAALEQVFEHGRGESGVLYVFRGFLPNQSPLQFQGAMVKYQRKSADQIVQIGLDPPSFRDFGITSVPATVLLDEKGQLVAKVAGLANFEWLKDQVARGEKGDLGNRGKTYKITEVDLIEQMKSRAAAVDYKKQAEEAKKRYFQQLATIDLPYATEQRVRKVMPVLEVKSDIRDKDGVIRHQAGDRIDMKDELARAPVLIVFNSQDRYHVEFAKAMAKKVPVGRKVIYLTTRVDRDAGIAGYARQEYALGRPVYLLMQDVKNTFGIERVPTVVTPTDNEFLVVEVPLTQGASGDAGTDAP